VFLGARGPVGAEEEEEDGLFAGGADGREAGPEEKEEEEEEEEGPGLVVREEEEEENEGWLVRGLEGEEKGLFAGRAGEPEAAAEEEEEEEAALSLRGGDGLGPSRKADPDEELDEQRAVGLVVMGVEAELSIWTRTEGVSRRPV
jgi:hypothetical protein